MYIEYILSVMTFLIHNLEYFAFNFSVHSTNTRKKVQLHRPTANFAPYQRGVYYASIKIFNTVPASTAELVKDSEQFMSALKRFSIVQSFYSTYKYLNYQHEIKNDDSCI
jgi:hypothetical protein